MNTHILKNPRITEKVSNALEHNVYTFDITSASNKTELKKAFFELYKVKPVKINVINTKRKNIMSKGRAGVRGGSRKAMVYLKPGDKIDFV